MAGIEWNDELLRYAHIVIGAHTQKLAGKFGLQHADREDCASRMWLDLFRRARWYDPARGSPHAFIGIVVRHTRKVLARSHYDGEDARWRKRIYFNTDIGSQEQSDEEFLALLSEDAYRQQLTGVTRTFVGELDERIELAKRLADVGQDLLALAEDVASRGLSAVARGRGMSRGRLRRQIHRLGRSKASSNSRRPILRNAE